MGFLPADVAAALTFIEKTDPAARVPGGSAGLTERDRLGIEGIVAQSAQALDWVLCTVVSLSSTGIEAIAARQEAKRLWEILSGFSSAKRRVIVKQSREYRLWALAELICHESVKTVRDDAGRAVELAELALLIAELTPGEETWRCRLQGYAWAHIA